MRGYTSTTVSDVEPETSNDGQREELVRVSALHALTYCERLYYLQHVEGISTPDDKVHAGRTLHEAEVDRNRDWQSVELASAS